MKVEIVPFKDPRNDVAVRMLLASGFEMTGLGPSGATCDCRFCREMGGINLSVELKKGVYNEELDEQHMITLDMRFPQDKNDHIEPIMGIESIMYSDGKGNQESEPIMLYYGLIPRTNEDMQTLFRLIRIDTVLEGVRL